MKKFILLFFCSIFYFPMLQAQESSDIELDPLDKFKFDINLHFSTAVPINQLKGNMDPGFGFGATALFGKKGLPVLAGIDYRFHWHNMASADVYIDNGVFDELHDLSTLTYSHQGDLMIRIAPEIDFPIVPYFDVFLGFNRFATWTSIEGDDEYEDDPDLDSYNTRYKETGDWTKAYGAGVGLRINLFPQEDLPQLALNIRAAYRKGGIASYFTKKDDFEIIESTFEAFEEKNTTTDFLMLQLGVSFVWN